MSSPSWLDYLKQSLRKPDYRVGVLGIGQEFNGDDAAGIVIARGLQARMAGQDRLLIIDAGPAPENQTGALRKFKPDLVLLIDAAQMGETPGTIRWLAWQDTTGISASTHTLPLYMLGQYLTAEFGCEVALLGIQPFSNQMDVPLSPIMQQAVESVIEGLAGALL